MPRTVTRASHPVCLIIPHGFRNACSGLKTKALIRVEVDGENAREVARYDMGNRIRSVIEGPDGALWVLEDGETGRLLELRPE